MNIRAKEVRKNCKGHLWKMRVTWLECVIKSMKFGLTLISSGAGAGAGAGGRVVPVRTVPPEPSLIQIRWVPSHRCVLHYALCVTTASAFSDAVRPSVCSNSRRATRPLLIVSQAAVTHSCVYKQTNKQTIRIGTVFTMPPPVAILNHTHTLGKLEPCVLKMPFNIIPIYA
jgi:hypothetical protein